MHSLLWLTDFAETKLELTSIVDDYVPDGVKLKQLAFFDGDLKVTIAAWLGLVRVGDATDCAPAEQSSGRSDNHQDSMVESERV